jgi:hypothetical protein
MTLHPILASKRLTATVQRAGLALAAALLLLLPLSAQKVVTPTPRFQAFDDAGAPLAAGKLFSYVCGTTTPKATYTSSTGAATNANPTELDGSGYADIWLTGGECYKFKLTDAYDATIWTVDNVNATAGGVFTTLSLSDLLTSSSRIVITTASNKAVEMSASGEFGLDASNAGGTLGLYTEGTRRLRVLDDQLLGEVSELRMQKDGTPAVVVDDTGTSGRAYGMMSDGGTFYLRDFTGAINRWSMDSSGHLASVASQNLTVGGVVISGAAAGPKIELTGGQLIAYTANGSQWYRGQASEEITLSTSGTTTDSTADMLPANSLIEGVACRVTQAITTSANWALGDSAQGSRFLAATTDLSAGTTKVGLLQHNPANATNDLGPVQAANAKLRITTNAAAGAGKIRCTVYYSQFIPPTS